MLEELRLNPRAPGARSWGRRPGEAAATDGAERRTGFSTGFAETERARSTGLAACIAGVSALIQPGPEECGVPAEPQPPAQARWGDKEVVV